MSMIIDGTNGLTFNNATTQASAGVVLQVVNATYATFTGTASTTLVATGITASITPKFSTSKILVITNMNGIYSTSAGVTNWCHSELFKNGSTLNAISDVNAYNTGISVNSPFTYFDSPATTSATTYAVYYKNGGAGGATIYFNNYAGTASNTVSTITLMEIAQ